MFNVYVYLYDLIIDLVFMENIIIYLKNCKYCSFANGINEGILFVEFLMLFD